MRWALPRCHAEAGAWAGTLRTCQVFQGDSGERLQHRRLDIVRVWQSSLYQEGQLAKRQLLARCSPGLQQGGPSARAVGTYHFMTQQEAGTE